MFSSEDLELFFTYGHRRSCSIMQRNSIEDAEITKKMEELLQDDSDPLVFDKISHDGCGKYKERVNIESDLLDMEVCIMDVLFKLSNTISHFSLEISSTASLLRLSLTASTRRLRI